MTSDHPRACGANEVLEPCVARKYGSSPRMRGKLGKSINIIRGDRIIPAHAGQTPASASRRRPSPDHPRACGANHISIRKPKTGGGSSPRMRGKPHVVDDLDRGVRIIPAHAGQTQRCFKTSKHGSDHPRACGANSISRWVWVITFGSSPRMRGKLLGEFAHRIQRRIIPAHAGQTSRRTRLLRLVSDHPRACGANTTTKPPTRRNNGSSPRMRGKLFDRNHITANTRIIPAHAGQTSVMESSSSPSADHPRACGANSWHCLHRPRPNGSSPRMRGKRIVENRVRKSRRIIPAHAGQTGTRATHSHAPSDHPRACGANFMVFFTNCSYSGSSPRMRGKLHRSHLRTDVPRIIPAHAGQTCPK